MTKILNAAQKKITHNEPESSTLQATFQHICWQEGIRLLHFVAQGAMAQLSTSEQFNYTLIRQSSRCRAVQS